MPPQVAVIILNWNGISHTCECIRSLLASGYHNLHIIIVDNNSDQDEAGVLESQFGSSITVIRNHKNLGVAGGNNSGIAFALRDQAVKYVVLMNNDLVVKAGSINALVEAAENTPETGMVASRMMNYYQRDRVDNLGIMLTTAGLGYNRKSERDPLFCPCSGFGLYSAAALSELAQQGEIWDDDFFAYVDELDVGFRLRLLGYGTAYTRDAVAYHKEGATSGGGFSPFAIYHGHRNTVWMIIKDFPALPLLLYAPLILAAQVFSILYHLVRGNVRVILRAKWHGVRGIPRMWKKRKHIQSSRRVGLGSITASMVKRPLVLRPAG